MNKQTRKELSEISDQLAGLIVSVEEIRDGEQDKFDNLPEGIQESERGQKFEEAIGSLEEVISSLEEAVNGIETAAE